MPLIPGPDVLVAHLAGEAVLLNLRDKNYYRLNETASLVWKALEERATRDVIVDRLVESYEVDKSDAAAEVDRILDDLLAKGLLELAESRSDDAVIRP